MLSRPSPHRIFLSRRKADGQHSPRVTTLASILSRVPTGVQSARRRMKVSMVQRSLLWVQNNETLVVGGAISLFAVSLTLGLCYDPVHHRRPCGSWRVHSCLRSLCKTSQ